MTEQKVPTVPQDQPIVDTQDISPPATPAKGNMLVLGVALGIVLSLGAVTAMYFFVIKPELTKLQKSSAGNKDINNMGNTPGVSGFTGSNIHISPAPSLTPTIGKKDGTIWYEPQKKITAVNVFQIGKSEDEGAAGYDTKNAEFYEVAKLEDGGVLIDSFVPSFGPGGAALFRFIRAGDRYSILTNYLNQWIKESLDKIVLGEVKPVTRNIAGIETPPTITVNGLKLTLGSPDPIRFENLKNSTVLGNSDYGQVYVTYEPILDSDKIFARSLYLVLKDGLFVSYVPDMIASSDDMVPQITWNDNTKNTARFRQNVVASCGLGMMYSLPLVKKDSQLLTGKNEIGKTVSGQPVYQLTDAGSLLVKALYNSYKVGRDYTGAPPYLTLGEFAQKRNHFLWQDALGDWQIFVDETYAPMAECGKPVIYLYPRQVQQVNVQVGARIRVSNPTYKDNGWLVKAHPDGTIEADGKVYPYLYWEGLGNGVYPDIHSSGSVVRQSELLAKISKDLTTLGLNSREIANFKEFWLPKMPTAPYVRLTWLGTRDMDALAPLTISPKPDTVIRVFLDFAGLEKPVILKPQMLSAVARHGFTVVEWGGLLLGDQ
jgi:hypothetical protein